MLSGVNSRWSKSLYSYLFVLLIGLYAYALYSADWNSEIAMLSLCSALALALWQKASDRVPYLLDSVAAPPSRVALADSLIAATIFFALQNMVSVVLRHYVHGDATSRIVLAYICAGALTYALVRGTFAALNTNGIPKLLGPDLAQSIRTGVATGLLCASVGIGYLWFARRHGFLPDTAAPQLLPTQARAAIGLLTVLAAPLFEEFIFRGLIFGGMRRSICLPMSTLGSAALFAIAHPLTSLAPLFVLGIATAWVYEHKQALLAPMLTHAVYNAAIVGYSVFVIQS